MEGEEFTACNRYKEFSRDKVYPKVGGKISFIFFIKNLNKLRNSTKNLKDSITE